MKEPTSPAVLPEDAWDVLSPLLTARRKQRLLTAAKNRTNKLRLLVQDVHQPHNVSACLRSAEAFGIVDVDVITLQQAFKPSTVCRGVAHWLNIHRHKHIDRCVSSLRAQNFRIAAALPSPEAKPLHELPTDQPLALLFGNEHAGLSPEWQEHIDWPFTIPMCGLVESLNISVSAAISLQHMSQRMRETIKEYHLRSHEQQDLLNHWICRQLAPWEEKYALRKKGCN